MKINVKDYENQGCDATNVQSSVIQDSRQQISKSKYLENEIGHEHVAKGVFKKFFSMNITNF